MDQKSQYLGEHRGAMKAPFPLNDQSLYIMKRIILTISKVFALQDFRKLKAENFVCKNRNVCDELSLCKAVDKAKYIDIFKMSLP